MVAMSISYVIFLAIIQGLTEFLPISSSGHLALAPKLLAAADQGLVMDVALHIGTLLAIVVYYRRDVWGMAASVIFWRDPARAFERRLALFIALASIPAVLVGYALHVFVPDGIRALWVIIATTLFFGIAMGIADHVMPRDKVISDLRLRHALIIGVAQAFALVPGTSRSGVTMTAARGLGLVRPEAARFSFLLSIPANAAASILVIGDALSSGEKLGGDVIMTGVLTFFIALGAIAFLMRMLRTMSFLPFVFYRVVLGFFLLGLIYWGVPLGAVN